MPQKSINLNKGKYVIRMMIVAACLVSLACVPEEAPESRQPAVNEGTWLSEDRHAADLWEDSLLPEMHHRYPYYKRQQMWSLPQINERHQLPYPESLLFYPDNAPFPTSGE